VARAAEAVRLASLAHQPASANAQQQYTASTVAGQGAGNMQLSRHARRIYCGSLPVRARGPACWAVLAAACWLRALGVLLRGRALPTARAAGGLTAYMLHAAWG